MQPSLYVSLSGQIALQKRLDTIANNVANVNTSGYRAEEVRFETILSEASREPTAYSSAGETFLSRKSGGFIETNNRFDVAIKGDAFMAIETPVGQVYTRDGRMQMSPDGGLQTLNGHPVLDVGGAPIQLDPNGGDVTIAPDGTLTQGGQQRGALGLFTISNDARLARYENSGVIPDLPAEPALDFARNGFAQGFIEQSNVNPVAEITRLITVQRSFEAVTNAMSQTDERQRDSIQKLGPSS
jgi:flagellar basal-body rod protein FlgF